MSEASQVIEMISIFSSPGRIPRRAIVPSPTSALAKCKSFYVKFFLCDGQGAVRRGHVLYVMIFIQFLQMYYICQKTDD